MAIVPAGNLTSSAGLSTIQEYYYQRKALDRRQKKFMFRSLFDEQPLPLHNGRTMKFHRFNGFQSNTTAATEGNYGSSGTISALTLSATVSQYDSFVTLSDLLMDTAISPMLEATSDLLGEQAGLSADVIARTVLDDENASCVLTCLDGSFMRVADVASGKQILSGLDVEPFANGVFEMLVHPYVSYDIIFDPNPIGYPDLVKSQSIAGTPITKYEDRGLVTTIGGVRIRESTNVYTQTGPNRYRAYLSGKGNAATVDLEGRGPTKVEDPRNQKFSLNIIKGKVDLSNPTGTIGGAVSYNYSTCHVVLETAVYRMRQWDPQSTIA